MADEPLTLTDQASIELPNGIIVTGAGEQDTEAIQEQIEERHEALNPDQAPQEPAQPRQTRGQKRFGELTREREDAVRRAEAAEQRAKELEARLNAPQQPVAAQQQAEPPAQPAQTRPKPQESEIGLKYKTLSEYFEDLGNWQFEQREAALMNTFDARLQAGIEADRASRNRTDHAQNVFAAGRAAFTDFDATLAKVNDILVPPSHQDAIWKMPNAERILYALANDRPALEALVKETDPVLVGVRLATLNIPRTEAVASPASTPVAVRTTNAPAPPQPVSGGSRTAQTSSADIANAGGNFADYKKLRNSERGIH